MHSINKHIVKTLLVSGIAMKKLGLITLLFSFSALASAQTVEDDDILMTMVPILAALKSATPVPTPTEPPTQTNVLEPKSYRPKTGVYPPGGYPTIPIPPSDGGPITYPTY